MDCHGRSSKDANTHVCLEENKVFIPRARSFFIGLAKKGLCSGVVTVTVRHVMRYTSTKFHTHDRVPRLAGPARLESPCVDVRGVSPEVPAGSWLDTARTGFSLNTNQ